MRSWVRAGAETWCGGPCGRRIAKGDPMLVIEHKGVAGEQAFSWTKFRCARCAGEDAPDLPPLETTDERGARIADTREAAMKRLTGAFQPGLALEDQG